MFKKFNFDEQIVISFFVIIKHMFPNNKNNLTFYFTIFKL